MTTPAAPDDLTTRALIAEGAATVGRRRAELAAAQVEAAGLREALERIHIETINRCVHDETTNAQVLQWTYTHAAEALALTPTPNAARGAALLALNDALSDLARYAEHPECYDCAEVCTCGLDRVQARVKAARAARAAYLATSPRPGEGVTEEYPGEVFDA